MGLREEKPASGISLILGIHNGCTSFPLILGYVRDSLMMVLPASELLLETKPPIPLFPLYRHLYSGSLCLSLTRYTCVNEHYCILSSCLLTERETRDLHREWETSGDRDPDPLLQNYAGICYLVRGALFWFKVPFFPAGEGGGQE